MLPMATAMNRAWESENDARFWAIRLSVAAWLVVTSRALRRPWSVSSAGCRCPSTPS